MTAEVKIYVEDIASTIATYDTIRLYRGTDPSVYPFTGLPVTTATLVADTEEYTLTDSAGTADDYYRFSYYSSISTVESAQSDAIKPGAVTLKTLIAEAARECGMGFSAVADAGSSATKVICARLLDMGVDAGYMGGAFIWRPSAAANNDRIRRIGEQGFSTADGSFTPTRAWATGPAADEVFYVTNLFPAIDWEGFPFSWARAARAATEHLYFTDRLNLGTGTATNKTRFDLATHLAYAREDNIRRVLVQTTDSDGNVTEWELGTQGTDWTPVPDNDGLSIDTVDYVLSTSETLIVEVNRTYDPMYAVDDVLTGPLALATRAVAAEVFKRANAFYAGKYGAEATYWTAEFTSLYNLRYRPRHVVRGL